MAEYISRQAVLRCIKESRDGIDWGQSEDGDAFLHYSASLYRTVASKECVPSADVVPVVHGEWIKQGKQMIINLENAREQYAALGYPHRNEYRLQCSVCGKITMVDGGIVYEYCPHCGSDMRRKEER